MRKVPAKDNSRHVGRISLLLLSIVSITSALLLAEITLRGLIEPSPYSYGRLLGIELPPYRLVSAEPVRLSGDRSEWADGLIVDGNRITVGDLWGINREDPLLGYVPLEDAVSANGWWQSNNIGARARQPTSTQPAEGVTRILVFGESFTQGSRVRQEETWPYYLDVSRQDVEVVNLAVDGYSMAQSYLRYLEMRERIGHDIVILMFVPAVDLWRDVNVRRDVGAYWWGTETVMPRFVGEDGRLTLVAPPAASKSESAESTMRSILWSHLENYDSFFNEKVYEEPDGLGHSVIYRLGLRQWHIMSNKRYRESLWDPQSEAQRVTREIFLSMDSQVEADGKQFLLVTLPLSWELEGKAYADRHERLCKSVGDSGVGCLDLMEGLRNISPIELDLTYDGSHFGPSTNRIIADLILDYLNDQELLQPKMPDTKEKL
jgi:hypothetical protein